MNEEYIHALNEWRAARNRFEYAADDEKTRLAIYELMSARSKLMYLMHQEDET